MFGSPGNLPFSKLNPRVVSLVSLSIRMGCLVAAVALGRADTPADRAWSQVPEILERIVPPSFPDRVFDVTEHGAVAGGEVSCTAAFRAAIEACAEAGGGRVRVPAGRFLTGPIHLRSKVELHLAEGAELVFSDRFEDYLPPVLVRVGGVECYNYSPLIYARGCEDVAVTGKGRLNGNSRAWWTWKGKETREHFRMGAEGVPVEERVFGTVEAAIRPSFLCLFDCRNVLLEDFTIGSGPNWTIHPVYCENLTIRRVTVDTDGPNNDGIDPDSCRDVLIEHCTFSTGDDCVVLKSGYNQDGWRVGKPTENVIMRHCSSRHGHGGLVIGSEMSGDVRKVFMHDCQFEGTDRAIRIKSRADRGGVVEQVYARDITVKDMVHEAVILNMAYGADPSGLTSDQAPVFRDMCFERIRGSGMPHAVVIRGMAKSPIENIRFREVELASDRGVVASDVRDLLFERFEVSPKKGPAFDLTNASGITLRAGIVPEGEEAYLELKGEGSRGVVVEATPGAEGRVRASDGASAVKVGPGS